MEQAAQSVNSMPRIREKYPPFRAVTTKGNINCPSDYSDKWVILFSLQQ